MKILNLPLEAKWYKLIEAGQKTEEYREIKPYWIRRLCETLKTTPFNRCILESCCKECFNDPYDGRGFEQIQFDTVRFHYGYTMRTMTFKVEEIRVGRGKPEWGAPPEENVFIIKLGKRIS